MKKPKRTKKRDTGTMAETPKKMFQITKAQVIIKNAFNVRVTFNKMNKKLSYDELTDRILINGAMVPAEWVLRDLRVQADLLYGFQPTEKMFQDGAGEYARENTFHPLREYLDGLKWDRQKRLDDMLMMYFGSKDSPFNRAIGKLFMIAAVRRMRIKIVEGDGPVKFDQLLILEGAQGSEKSTALKILAGGSQYFTDAVPINADSKKFLEIATGKWIVEFPELVGIGKRDASHFKAMLSQDTDRARLAYDRNATEKPRTCIFVGTTNSSNYLKDITGNRRYWPVKTGQINLEDLRRDRDQLWAEAAYLEKKGESIVLDDGLWADAAIEQAARTAQDPWQDKLVAITTMEGVAWAWGDGTDEDGKPIKVKVPFPKAKSLKIRAADTYRLLGIRLEHQTQAQGARIGEIMGVAGFDHRAQRFAGSPATNAYTLRRGDDAKKPVTVKVFEYQHDQGKMGIRVSTKVDCVKPGTPDDGQGKLDDDIPF